MLWDAIVCHNSTDVLYFNKLQLCWWFVPPRLCYVTAGISNRPQIDSDALSLQSSIRDNGTHFTHTHVDACTHTHLCIIVMGKGVRWDVYFVNEKLSSRSPVHSETFWPQGSEIIFHYLDAVLSIMCKSFSTAVTQMLTITWRAVQQPIRTSGWFKSKRIKLFLIISKW